MDKKIFQLCETLIKEEDIFLVPVKKLFQLLKEEKENISFSYDELLEALREKEEFTVIDILDQEISSEICTPEHENELEECGFFSGPVVFMSYDTPPEDVYLDLLSTKVSELITALQDIYSTNMMNRDIEEDKNEEVLTLINRAEQIRDKIELTKKGLGI